MRPSPFMKLIHDAVYKAGRGLSRDFGELENLQVSKKGPSDFVTSADLRAEKILIEELKEIRPKYGFLVEESGVIEGEDKKHRWIVDPLDGTRNFMHGVPHFCTSVALEQTQPNGRKEIIACVTFAPALNEIYWAEKGLGAWAGNRRLQVSPRSKAEEILIAGYFARGSEEQQKHNLDAMKQIGSSMRVMGSAAMELAYVAAGKLDAFWHHDLKPWDMAAGILLVKEARGMVVDMKGNQDMMGSNSIIATNENIHDLMFKALKRR